jgi:hypothetical protein
MAFVFQRVCSGLSKHKEKGKSKRNKTILLWFPGADPDIKYQCG